MNKRSFVFTLALSLVLIFTFSFQVFAQNNVSFSLSSDNADENRLFYIYTNAHSDSEKLGAVKLTYTYDPSVIEFRDASTQENAEVEYSDEDGVLSLIYLCDEGEDLSEGKNIVSLKFKAVNEGDTLITLLPEQCINASAQDLTATATDYTLSVSASGSVKVSKSKSTKLKEGELSTAKVQDSQLSNAYGDLEKLSVDSDYSTAQIVKDIILLIVLLALIFFLAYRIGKRRKLKKRNENSQDNNSDSTEDD